MGETERKLRQELGNVVQARQSEEEEAVRNVVGGVEAQEDPADGQVASLKRHLRETLESQEDMKQSEEERQRAQEELDALQDELDQLRRQLDDDRASKRIRDWFMFVAAGMATSFAAVVGFMNQK